MVGIEGHTVICLKSFLTVAFPCVLTGTEKDFLLGDIAVFEGVFQPLAGAVQVNVHITDPAVAHTLIEIVSDFLRGEGLGIIVIDLRDGDIQSKDIVASVGEIVQIVCRVRCIRHTGLNFIAADGKTNAQQQDRGQNQADYG